MESPLSPRGKWCVTLIGAGAVGTALATALHAKRIFVRSVLSEHGRSAKLLGKRVKAPESGSLRRHRIGEGIIIIAVPDDEIENVVRQIAVRRSSFSGSVVFHTSGALTADLLAPLRRKGAAVGSFHPLRAFAKAEQASATLKGIAVALEGDPSAMRIGKRLARVLGARPFVLSPEQKVFYHIAAVFSSNYVVTILSVLEELALRIGLPRKKALAVFEPLILQSLKNVRSHPAATVLTGPVARGDGRTIALHRRSLRNARLVRTEKLYAALATAAKGLTSKKKR